MNPPQPFVEFIRRNIRRFHVACATAAFLLVAVAAILLATFEAALWKLKVLVRPRAGEAATGP
jgi:hypothetical protein